MILVFGRSGQVAMALQRQADVTALGRDQADLSDPEGCAKAILAYRPSVVINAAAYTAVDAAEADEHAAMVINAQAPGAMARACAELAVPFLHVSTDYVFAGTGDKPRSESDKVAPINAYGRTKRAGETAVLSAEGTCAILRTSWVFSAYGSNFVKTMLRLSETRDQLDVVCDQIGGPTPADDIACALLEMATALQNGHAGGLYHFAGKPDVSWATFASEIFRQAGRSVKVTGIATKDYPTPATRPLNSRLSCKKIENDFGLAAPDWRLGLTRVLQELKAIKE